MRTDLLENRQFSFRQWSKNQPGYEILKKIIKNWNWQFSQKCENHPTSDRKISAETPNLFGGTFTKQKKNKLLTLGSILFFKIPGVIFFFPCDTQQIPAGCPLSIMGKNLLKFKIIDLYAEYRPWSWAFLYLGFGPNQACLGFTSHGALFQQCPWPRPLPYYT